MNEKERIRQEDMLIDLYQEDKEILENRKKEEAKRELDYWLELVVQTSDREIFECINLVLIKDGSAPLEHESDVWAILDTIESKLNDGASNPSWTTRPDKCGHGRYICLHYLRSHLTVERIEKFINYYDE